MAVMYIHGKGGSGNGATAVSLREYIPDLIAPSYDYRTPEASLTQLINVVDSVPNNEDLIIIASSLGGWYAEEIAKCRVVDLILFNPVIDPRPTLSRVTEEAIEDLICAYEEIGRRKKSRLNIRRYVYLSVDDPLIPYAPSCLKYSKMGAALRFTDGGHRMTKRHMPEIISTVKDLTNSLI